ncbi:PREDICTED: T-box transcription factor TBX6-like [Gavialis gangeticus]|uniref:T-box transcription factor TBX6-like n=1 Tax=Gavialis gangeticus TaxID=94835 RepID=UPI00092F3F20|nr:PREDICTED: T-box transcription factor TBX6-like [Gavialis gangeticus]
MLHAPGHLYVSSSRHQCQYRHQPCDSCSLGNQQRAPVLMPECDPLPPYSRCQGSLTCFQMLPLQSLQLAPLCNKGCLPTAVNGLYGKVHLSLENKALWEEFYTLGTEMIITKSGRRMFPPCKMIASGLDPHSLYLMLMDIVPSDNARYKWHCGHWEVVGKADPHFPSHFYLHPDSPAPGSHWMKEPISFQRLKITNNTLEQCEHIILHSMHKYQPRFHVVLTSHHTFTLPWNAVTTFVFPETTFMAVTAYQNSKITQMKIDNNPFAKGFRENGLSYKKNRRKNVRGTEVVKQASVEETCCELPTGADQVGWEKIQL